MAKPALAELRAALNGANEFLQMAAVEGLGRFRPPEAPARNLRERIERFVSLRVQLWEKVHLLALLQRSVVLQDPDAAPMVDFVRRAMADQVQEHFAPELRARSAAQRDDAVALIAMLTSVESWDQFRNAYGRSPLQTQRAWARTIHALLSDGGPAA